MNAIAVLQIVEAGLALAANLMISMQRYAQLVITARTEGREITDAELDTIQAESQQKLDDLQALLTGNSTNGGQS